MKPFLVVTLLILSTLLLCEAQGINRKLMTKTIPSSATRAAKNRKNDGNKDGENLAIRISSPPQHSNYVPPRYPDVIDLAGMDYSPARRKPPIHN